MIETMYTTPLLPLGNFCLLYKPVSLHLAAVTERHPRSLHSVRVSGLGLVSSGMTGSLWNECRVGCHGRSVATTPHSPRRKANDTLRHDRFTIVCVSCGKANQPSSRNNNINLLISLLG